MANFYDVRKAWVITMRILVVILSMLLLGGCLNYDFSGQTIKQGNMISAKKLNQLKLGMSKQEVLLVLGSNLNSPLLQQNRWDYIQTTQPANEPIAFKTLSLFFKGERLSQIKKGAGKTN